VPGVRQHDPTLPEALEALLLEMMAKNPQQRPTLTRVRQVLDELLAAQPAPGTAEPPEEETTGARTADFKRLHQMALRRTSEWSDLVGDAVPADLEERPPEAPREELTRTDADVLGKALLSPDHKPKLQTPDSIPVLDAVTEVSNAPIDAVGDDPDEGDPTNMQDATGAPTRESGQRRLAATPALGEDPIAPALADPRAPEAPRWPGELGGSVDTRRPVRANPEPAPTRGSVPSLPRMPLRNSSRLRAATARVMAGVDRVHSLGKRLPRHTYLVLGGAALLTLCLALWLRLGSGPGTVRLFVRGLPATSTVLWGSRVLTSNPSMVPRSTEPVTLTIRTPGYETVKLDLTPSEDIELPVELGSPRTPEP
jgi:hypothetical protein